MRKFFIIFICTLFFTGCSSNSDTVQSRMYSIDGVDNMMYDSNTEIVAIYTGKYKSINAFYHGHPLYYCSHEKKFYYYDTNENVIFITVENLNHTLKEGAKDEVLEN